jgi:hypothetical protein
MLRPVRMTAEPLVNRISVLYLYVSDMERSAAALEVSDPDGYRLHLYQPPPR